MASRASKKRLLLAKKKEMIKLIKLDPNLTITQLSKCLNTTQVNVSTWKKEIKENNHETV